MSYGQFRPQIYKIARELQKNIFTWLQGLHFLQMNWAYQSQ